MQTILVLGAGGRLGRAVAAAFLAAGWRVKGQVRPGGRARLGPGVEPVETDGRDGAALAAAAGDADVVFHGLNPRYTDWEREVMPLAEAAIAAAAANRATLLLPGNVYNFGAGMPAELTPATPAAPTTSKGRIRVALEERLAAAAKQAGFRFVVLRAGDFFGGEGPGTWIDLAIAKDLAKGRISLPAPPEVPHAWAYIPDLAAAFVALARVREGLGTVERFHFPGHTVTGADLAAAIEAAAGRSLRVSAMPWWLLRIAALVSPMMRALLEMKYLWDVPHGLADPRLEVVAGPLPGTPFRTAIRDALVAQKLLPA